MVIIPLPKLLDKSGNYIRSFRPLKVSVEQSIVPLSTASIELPEDESLPARNYVEVFTSMGSAGIFRIRSPQNAYGEDTSVCELEHAIVEVGDYLVREKIAEMMSPKAAMQRIFSHYRGSRWRLGNVDALGTNPIAVQINYENCLTAMISILEQVPSCYMTFDFSTSPWTVMVAAKGSAVGAEGRLSRNVESAKIIYDDSELCTRAYYEVETTDTSGEPSSEWRSLDADTINTYGVVEREVQTGAGFTAEEALYAAQEYLSKHKKPRVSVEISGQDLSQITGESLDTFTIGKLFRLSLVDYDLTIEDVITGLSWNDVYGNPTEVTVNLADEEDTAVVYIHDIESSGGRSGGGGGGRKRQEDTFKEYYTRFTKTDRLIDMEARHVAQNGSILQQAGMYLDVNGILQYARDNEKNIGSMFKVQADNITAKVSKGDVATQLAVECGNVHISGTSGAANLIVDGYIKTSELSTAIANITDGITVQGTLNAGTVDATDVEASNVRSSHFYVDETTLMNIIDASVSGNVLTIHRLVGEDVTFNKAVSLSGEWSGNVSAGKSFQYQAKQNNVVVGTGYSPAVDSIYRYAAVVWDADNKGFSVKMRAQDANGTDLIEEEITFDTTVSYNAGRDSATIRPTNIGINTTSGSATVLTSIAATRFVAGRYLNFTVGSTRYSISIT